MLTANEAKILSSEAECRLSSNVLNEISDLIVKSATKGDTSFTYKGFIPDEILCKIKTVGYSVMLLGTTEYFISW